MTKEWNIAVLLRNEPVPASYDIGKDGAPLEKRLVKDLLSAEVKAIQKSRALPGAHITALAWGSEEPKELLKKSLALGADEAIWIGREDWPQNANVRVIAESLKQIAADYDLLLLADVGSDTAGSALAAAVALSLGCRSFEGVMDYAMAESGLLLKRKLEEGRRQEIFAPLPLVLGLLPDPSVQAYYTLTGKLTAAEKEICAYPVSYRVLARKTAIPLTGAVYWRKKTLRPRTKQVWQPEAILSGSGRLDAMITGETEPKHGKRIEGTAEECAEQLLRYLLAEAFLKKRKPDAE